MTGFVSSRKLCFVISFIMPDNQTLFLVLWSFLNRRCCSNPECKISWFALHSCSGPLAVLHCKSKSRYGDRTVSYDLSCLGSGTWDVTKVEEIHHRLAMLNVWDMSHFHLSKAFPGFLTPVVGNQLLLSLRCNQVLCENHLAIMYLGGSHFNKIIFSRKSYSQCCFSLKSYKRRRTAKRWADSHFTAENCIQLQRQNKECLGISESSYSAAFFYISDSQSFYTEWSPKWNADIPQFHVRCKYHFLTSSKYNWN